MKHREMERTEELSWYSINKMDWSQYKYISNVEGDPEPRRYVGVQVTEFL
jgi:hypothetical protein